LKTDRFQAALVGLYAPMKIAEWADKETHGMEGTEELFHSPVNVAALRTEKTSKFGTEVSVSDVTSQKDHRPDTLLLGPFARGQTVPLVGFVGELKSQLSNPKYTRVEAWEQALGYHPLFTTRHPSVRVVIFAVIAAAGRGSDVRTGYKKNLGAFKTWDELDADEMREMLNWRSVPVNDDLRVEFRIQWCRVVSVVNQPSHVQCRAARHGQGLMQNSADINEPGQYDSDVSGNNYEPGQDAWSDFLALLGFTLSQVRVENDEQGVDRDGFFNP